MANYTPILVWSEHTRIVIIHIKKTKHPELNIAVSLFFKDIIKAKRIFIGYILNTGCTFLLSLERRFKLETQNSIHNLFLINLASI